MMRWLLIGALLHLGACTQDREPLVQELVEEEVARKLADFIATEKAKCLQEVMEEASMATDSILRANPILIRLDSLDKPSRPEKPGVPPMEKPPDSIQIAPIPKEH